MSRNPAFDDALSGRRTAKSGWIDRFRVHPTYRLSSCNSIRGRTVCAQFEAGPGWRKQLSKLSGNENRIHCLPSHCQVICAHVIANGWSWRCANGKTLSACIASNSWCTVFKRNFKFQHNNYISTAQNDCKWVLAYCFGFTSLHMLVPCVIRNCCQKEFVNQNDVLRSGVSTTESIIAICRKQRLNSQLMAINGQNTRISVQWLMHFQ